MIIDPIISKNVALIKDANGKDIERIYDRSGNLVFKNWNTLEGPFPIECFTSSNKLRNYRIYGNTIKDGTPAPENPVEVQGCGEYDAELNGYKIPVTVSNDTNSVTTPVYVGSEPLHKIGDYADYVDYKRGVVVRRIKKLVLTGKEGWTITSNGVLRIGLSGQLRMSTPLCTHYLGSNSTEWSKVPDKSVTVSIGGYLAILDTTYTAAADFKSYLAAQYAAGTPVTIWYVLAKPEEEVLPLSQKIPTNIGSNTFSCTISPAPSKAMIQYKKK